MPNASLFVEESGNIAKIERSGKEAGEVIDLSPYKVIPGLIELHIHGVKGHDTMDANFHALDGMSQHLARNGVTAFLAATVTSNYENTLTAVKNVAHCTERGLAGAMLLGSYLEGPYIGSKYKGAHPEEHIRSLELTEIEELIVASRNTIRVAALAPEKPQVTEAIKYLKSKGIKIAIGHSDATYTQAMAAIEAGANIAVHTFNGMRSLHHREPGILGAILTNDQIMAEVIADGVHVAQPIIEILCRCKSWKNIILVSDSIRAGGLADGEHLLGEMKVLVKDGVARIESGSLAGSTLRLMDAVRFMYENMKVPLLEAVHMASINPAASLGIDDVTGSIHKDKRADLVAIDENFNVVFSMVNGRIVYDQR
jgi:N-acetylglucosamine-6-phosphate deacetylase